tara:strand:+ start:41 stop:370 length:330 start_codon:yes stop_codon:yes gene_type:complete
MSDQKSTMSPKRLFIILCIAGLLMWFFSNSKVEVEVVVEPGIENTEKELEEYNEPKTNEVKVTKSRSKTKKRDVIITEENLEYVPQTQRKDLEKEIIKKEYIPQSQKED